MRNALRRIAFGALGSGMVIAMVAGGATLTANAAVSARSNTAAAALQPALLWPPVHIGDHGARVFTVQYLLDQHGHHLVVDGEFGVLTKFAVELFQKHNGIRPSGNVGAKTWPKLIVTVWRGRQGNAVAAVQAQLHYVYGFHFLAVDGVFGPITERAVKLFQKRYGLVPTGVVNAHTWNALVVHDM